MKKIISLLLTVLLLLSVTGTVYAAETELTTDSSWKITVSSDISNTAGYAFDGDPDTHWHSKYVAEGDTIKSHDECPFYITVDFGKTMKISGWKYTPRQGNGSGIVTKYNIYASTDGYTFRQIYTGTFDYLTKYEENRPVGKASWGNVEMKAIKIEYLEALNGYGSAAEINFYTGGSGKTNGTGETLSEGSSASATTDSTASGTNGKLSKKGWKITATSEIGWGYAEKMIDGDAKTFWHTSYTSEGSTITSKDNPPFTVELTLPSAESVTGFMYTPRPDNQAGRWESADVYVSADGKDKGDKVGTVTSDGESTDPITIAFGKKLTAKTVTVIVNKARGDYGSCAEIDLLTDEVKEGAASSSASTEDTWENFIAGLKTLDKTSWQITANSEMSWGPASKMIDGELEGNVYWHSNYDSQAGTHDENPFTVELTLSKAEKATGLLYYPRRDNGNGRWLSADVYVSADGKGKGDLVGTIEGETESDKAIVLAFGKELTVKKVTIIVNESVNKYATCLELDLISGEINFPKEDFGPELTENEEGMYSTKGWKFKVNSAISYGAVEKAFDDDKATFWHTSYTSEGSTITSHDNPPYYIDIVLPETKIISGFTMYGRSGNTTGRVTGYELYAADSDDGELVLVAKEEISASEKVVVEYGCGFEAKKMQFVVTESVGGYGVISELYFKKATDDEKLYPIAEFYEAADETMLKPIDKSAFKAENDLPVWGGQTVGKIFDNGGSFWQTDELGPDVGAVILKIDLGKVYTFSAVKIQPRSSTDFHGYWERFNMWSGENEEDMEEILHDYAFEEHSVGVKLINFETPITARYIEFEITKYGSKRVSCSEIDFLQNKEQRDATGGDGKYVMQIGSNEIKITRGATESVKTIDTAPYITSAGRTLIPLRGLLEEMGAEIAWEDKNQSITIEKDGLVLLLQIRNNLVYVDTPNFGKIVYTLESEPRIKDSRTFVPLRFLSEQFGYEVSWDGETQTITIEK